MQLADDGWKDWKLIVGLLFLFTIFVFKFSGSNSESETGEFSDQQLHSSKHDDGYGESRLPASVTTQHQSPSEWSNPFARSEATSRNASTTAELQQVTDIDAGNWGPPRINDETRSSDVNEQRFRFETGQGTLSAQNTDNRDALNPGKQHESDSDLPANQDTYNASTSAWTPDFNAIDSDTQKRIIKGRVISSNGQALEGVAILSLLRSGPQAGTFRASAIAGDSGSFTLSQLVPGDYTVTVQGNEMHSSTSKVLRTGDLSAKVVLPALRYWYIQGQVLDDYGSAVSGAKVYAAQISKPSVTDASGYFSFRLTADNRGGLLLRYEAEGYAESIRHLTGSELKGQVIDASVQMRHTGSLVLSGTVADQTGKPVDKALITLASRSPAYQLTAHTNTQGDFLFTDVRPSERVSITVSAGNQFDRLHRRDISLREDIHLPLSLNKSMTTTLVMQVSDSAGLPLPSLSFFTVNSSSGSNTQIATSDADGQLVIDDIKPGKLILRSAADSPNVIVNGISVGQNYNNVSKITVDTGEYNLRGRILDRDGLPMSATEVTMVFSAINSDVQSTTSRTVTSDEDGNFLFTGLGAGKRQIKVASLGEAERIYIADPLEYSNGKALLLK